MAAKDRYTHTLCNVELEWCLIFLKLAADFTMSYHKATIICVNFMYENYEAISGRINLYCTILVPQNNYASLTTPTSSHVYMQALSMFEVRDFTLQSTFLNTSNRGAGHGFASFFSNLQPPCQ